MRDLAGTMTSAEQAASTRGSAAGEAPPRTRRLIVFVPLIGFLGLVLTLAWGLSHDPGIVPSALIGKPVPQFSLPPVKGRTLGLSTADLQGHVSLVNVFASWCVACREEHPLLVQLKADNIVPIYGLDYKDPPDSAAQWLDKRGDPYTRTGADLNGRVAIDWGVYGVPETYVISKAGRIAYKQIGPVTPKILDQKILPLVRKLQRQ